MAQHMGARLPGSPFAHAEDIALKLPGASISHSLAPECHDGRPLCLALRHGLSLGGGERGLLDIGKGLAKRCEAPLCRTCLYAFAVKVQERRLERG